MNLVTLDRIYKQYSDRPLFENASLLINLGDRIGLIGVNGSGKTSLLKVVAGSEPPDKGSMTVTGGVRIEYLAQEPPLDDNATVLETIFRSQSPQMRLLAAYEAASAALQRQPDAAALQQQLLDLGAEMDQTQGWSAETNAKTVLTQLGITNFDARVGALSGGQRKRVALARALIDRADLLILDEPTNHIDADTVAWLEAYLASAPGALLMVTHDRYFLDRVANRIVEIDRRELVGYSGNYTRYLEQHAERHQRLAEAETKRQNLLRRELEWLRRQPMARGTKQKARKQRAEELLQLRFDSGADRVAIALTSRRLGRKALDAQGLVKRYDPRIVLDGLDLHLEPGDRIGIVGPNGAGKSTLLDILAGRLTPDRGSVEWGDTVQLGYYDQRSIDLRDSQRLIEFIENEAAVVRTKEGERVEAAQMLEWFLFPRPMQYARIGSLSGGERRRLYLLRTLIHQPNVLLLDEPTNDLDIQTLAVVEEYLDHFSGCLVVASHDRYFLDRTVDFLVAMEGGKLGPRYPGPYETFARLRQEEAQELDAPATATLAKTTRPKHEQRKLTWKEQQELTGLEARIATIEARQILLLDEIQKSGDNYAVLRNLSDELETIEEELDAALQRWLELSAIVAPADK